MVVVFARPHGVNPAARARNPDGSERPSTPTSECEPRMPVLDAPLTMFVERAAVIDSAVLCPQRGLFGITWLVDLTLGGAPSEPGMVRDFGRVKPEVKAFVDARYDHVLIVPTKAPNLTLVGDTNPELAWTDAEGRRYRHRAPRAAYAFVEAERITEDVMAAQLEADLAAWYGAGTTMLGVDVRTEAIDGAFYHYCHGLEHHAGKCQRIAHGHRSRLEIRRDGRRDEALEFAWARRWRDIYLGTRAHLVRDDGQTRSFAYEAADGAFELDVPAARCEILETETTIEQIARYIAQAIKAGGGSDEVEVRAYEGLEKGGLART